MGEDKRKLKRGYPMPGAGRPKKDDKKVYFNISIDRALKEAFKKKHGYLASSVIEYYIKKDLEN